jgi:hypothetical protein
MTPANLKHILRERAEQYAGTRGFEVDASHKEAILFKRLSDNFAQASFQKMTQNESWMARTKTKKGYGLEMRSSNSSDALLMSVFCHPQIGRWKGVRSLLGVSAIEPTFGFNASVALDTGHGDDTEIDMVVEDVFFEAKLTESDFTRKGVSVVKRYSSLATHFHSDCLVRREDQIDNYQLIRNLLAAVQHGKRHILICDARRPDLVRRYMETVTCLRDVTARRKCRFVSWQEIKDACGRELKDFLEEKYGL